MWTRIGVSGRWGCQGQRQRRALGRPGGDRGRSEGASTVGNVSESVKEGPREAAPAGGGAGRGAGTSHPSGARGGSQHRASSWPRRSARVPRTKAASNGPSQRAQRLRPAEGSRGAALTSQMPGGGASETDVRVLVGPIPVREDD